MTHIPTFGEILSAAETLSGLIVETPIIESEILNTSLDARILLKPESLQRTGSFKFRGAYNRISRVDIKKFRGGIAAYSSGNHAQGVAEAARLCNMPAAIVMPEDAPRLKIERTRRSGAEVVPYDRLKGDREKIAASLATSKGADFIPSYDDPFIIAGQGTVGLEITEQAERRNVALDAVVAPVGGGGLIAGVGLAMRERIAGIKIYGAEPVGFDDTARSLKSGVREKNTALGGSICDSLLALQPGKLTFEINQKQLADCFVVDEAMICQAVAFAFEELKLVVEPGGAVALAAVLGGHIPVQGKTVAVILSGGNVDPDAFVRILAKA